MGTESDWTPVGYARFASLGTAIAIATATPTAGTAYASLTDSHSNKAVPNHAIVTVYTQNVRVRDDGTSPTSSEGERVSAGTKHIITNSPEAIRKLRIIEETASASVTVRYYI